jgi:hypothetical protein
VTPSLNFSISDGVRVIAASATAGPDGAFVLTLPLGEYQMVLNVPGYSVRSLVYGTQDLLRTSTQISAGDPAEIRVGLAPIQP